MDVCFLFACADK